MNAYDAYMKEIAQQMRGEFLFPTERFAIYSVERKTTSLILDNASALG